MFGNKCTASPFYVLQSWGLRESLGIGQLSLCGLEPTLGHHKRLVCKSQSEWKVKYSADCNLWCKRVLQVVLETLSFPRHQMGTVTGNLQEMSQIGWRPWHWPQCKALSFLLEQVNNERNVTTILNQSELNGLHLFLKEGLHACTEEKWTTLVNQLMLTPPPTPCLKSSLCVFSTVGKSQPVS